MTLAKLETEKLDNLKDDVSESSHTDSGGSNDSHERGNWIGRLDFLLSLIGYAIGLGNIWRFPYLCYRNGGAAFLIPYLTFLFLCGMPLFFLEVSYGQFASLSPIAIWRICPLFKGVGWGMVIVSGVVCIYYNVIMAWTLYYLFMSFRSMVPWSTCNNEWNTDSCAAPKFIPYTNGTNTSAVTGLYMEVARNSSTLLRSPSEEFWRNNVLEITDGIENMGTIRWELLGCLVLAWVAVFLCLCKGVQSSGRVVYFSATFPYIVLIILLVRGVTLPGALDGIKYYVIPKWEKLLSFKVWGEAAMQIFYSVGMAWGGLITMASYNKFDHNCYRDARIVPLINSGTSIIAGFVTFSIIGFMSQETGMPIEKVVTQGPGLVFVLYPEAVGKMPISPLWAILFFLMLFTVGLDTQFGMFETLTSALLDQGSTVMRSKKTLTVATVCCLEFLLGLPCITQGGIYFLQIVDWYSSSFSLMTLALIECLAISWIYGVERLYKDIELMIGHRPCIWWKVCWCFITPGILVSVLLFSFIMHTPVSYGEYQYPPWAIGVGWVFALISLIPVPALAIWQIAHAEGSLIQRVKKLCKPSDNWGPAMNEDRQRYLLSLTGEAAPTESNEAMLKLELDLQESGECYL